LISDNAKSLALPANSLSSEFCLFSLSHRLQQVEGRPETELHIEQAQEKKAQEISAAGAVPA
jgi:hypothetical protein